MEQEKCEFWDIPVKVHLRPTHRTPRAPKGEQVVEFELKRMYSNRTLRGDLKRIAARTVRRKRPTSEQAKKLKPCIAVPCERAFVVGGSSIATHENSTIEESAD